MNRSPLRVLLVDDHTDTCEVVTRLLEMDNYVVTCAHTVAQAYEAINSGPFELLICDVALPDGEGLRLLAHARRWYAAQGITLSAFGETDTPARSKAAGFFAHLTKPFALAELKQALQNAMRIGSPAGSGSVTAMRSSPQG